MLGLISFKENGERLEHAGEQPGFYGLTVNGEVVEYYSTLEALWNAVEQINIELNHGRIQ